MNLISIITTVRNGADTIADCLSSIDSQSYTNVEHIIIDGASTDETLATIAKHPATYRQVFSEADSGIYDGMNKGLRLATGKIVGFLNADDMYADDQVLERVAQVFKDDKVSSCYGDLRYVDCHDTERTVRMWKSGEFKPEKFLWGWMPPHPTFFVKTKCYKNHGDFKLQLGTAADYEMMLRLLLKYQITVEYIPQILVKMRCGGASNSSIVQRLRANRMDRKAWQVNSLSPLPWTFICKPMRKLGQWWLRN